MNVSEFYRYFIIIFFKFFYFIVNVIKKFMKIVGNDFYKLFEVWLIEICD